MFFGCVSDWKGNILSCLQWCIRRASGEGQIETPCCKGRNLGPPLRVLKQSTQTDCVQVDMQSSSRLLCPDFLSIIDVLGEIILCNMGGGGGGGGGLSCAF